MSVTVLTVALPPYLIVTMHTPTWLVGVLFGLNTAMIVVLQMLVARGVASWRRTRSLVAGGLGWSLSFLLFAVAPLVSPTLLLFYLCGSLIVYTLAEIVYAPASTSLAAAMAPVGMQGRYLALFQLSQAGASTIAPALAGSLLALTPQGLWLFLALLMGGAAAWIVWLERRLPETALRATRPEEATKLQPEMDTQAETELCPSLHGQSEAHP
jgi:MFS family permease